MKRFAVAVAECGTESTHLHLHIVTAETWQKAFNQSPSTWWGIAEDANIKDEYERAKKQFNCLIAVKEL